MLYMATVFALGMIPVKKKDQICSLRLTPDENHYDLPVPIVAAFSGQILGRRVLESKVIEHGNQPYSTFLVFFYPFFHPSLSPNMSRNVFSMREKFTVITDPLHGKR